MANPLHYGGPNWDTVGCGHLARGRRRTEKLADVDCPGCRASREFKAAERSAAKVREYQERCGRKGHVPHPKLLGECLWCAAPLEVRHG